jgi:hypothetical protein
MACWIYCESNTVTNNVPFSVGDKTASHIHADFQVVSDGKIYAVVAGATDSDGGLSLAYSAQTWTPVILVAQSATYRALYVGGSSGNSTTDTGALSGVTNHFVGCKWNSGGTAATLFFEGKVACPVLDIGAEWDSSARAAYSGGTEGHKISGVTPDFYKDLIRNLSTPSDFGTAFTASGSPTATDHPALLTGQNKKQLTLTGTHSALGETIQTVIYRPDTGYDGSDSLTVKTTDAGDLSDTDSCAITVAAPPPGSPWSQWEIIPTNPIVYEHTAIDLGAIINFVPVVTFTGQGTATIYEAHSDTDSGYSSFVDITSGSGEINARWVKIKVSLADAFARFDGLDILITAEIIREIQSDIDTSTLTGGAGARRLALQKSFSLIKSVAPILQDVGAGWSATVADRNASLGPLIKIYNGSGTPTDTTMDFVIDGIA